jgi:hypothetical protein
MEGIIYYLSSYNKIEEIQTTNFFTDLKLNNDIINTNAVSGEVCYNLIFLKKIIYHFHF